jgi:predicted glycosyltransferase
MMEDNHLYCQDDKYSLTEAQSLRRQILLAAFNRYQPQAVLIELFPFGRKKFAGELLPLLKAAHRCGRNKPLIVCSLRDIMVNARKDQVRHDNRARWLVDRYFDAVLVHSDPQFAALEESFRPSRSLITPHYYTGFVLPSAEAPEKTLRQRRLVVSAGGGIVGAPLFKIAIQTQPILWEKLKLPMTLVGGPFLPEPDWRELTAQAKGCPGLTLYRHVPNMAEMLASHAISVSQCGYNTVMDILKSGIAALTVPFCQGQEDEQGNRALKLSRMGLLRTVDAGALDTERFVYEVEQLLDFKPNPSALDLDGAARSAEIIGKLLPSNSSGRSIGTKISDGAIDV